ncbi:RNA polymerase sigma factor [Rhodococcus sp. RS1C4]|uniref:RNA polymerase sigma factor n=1 Tax=Nocardiaceae TaxID=85025 RepID=UPI0003764DCA|nr:MULTISPECIES: RNA polymerase sigma factor [Rhodococcus]OZC54817.1 RNA polymerase sigma factor [Rhodococcus sp. RS1C4]OZC57871.1 RNA polymerase sigma factor [Rhodococcus sp. 06-621-2]OZC82555.1 RNA polymerase sigma factor [Rhodococcus sp. 06-418-1B]OZD10098.1 RNA polymerase sigma factor [Rhodococcus sp. 06-156-4C]OZD13961.1 RNA polymerase sigma factor [Rhodococcus sp. 06-156-4a]
MTDDPPGRVMSDGGPLSDHVLVSNAALGDTDAFELIVARYGPEMFRYARNMLSDHGAAEEVVQDAFVAAWKGLDTFRGDSKLRTWLFSMVSHKVVDHRRKRAVAPAEDWVFERRSTDARADPEVSVTNDDFMADLGRALAELPYRQRACWLLREVEGMTHPEIGQIMTLSASAVRGHLVRARATLSERLAAWQ